VTPAISDVIALSHSVLRSDPGDVHISGGCDSEHIRVIGGPDVCAILSAPIFDITALHALSSIDKYVKWLRVFADMSEADFAHYVSVTNCHPHYFSACVRRVPGPLLCAWGATWRSLPGVEDLSAEDREAYGEFFDQIHGGLVALAPFARERLAVCRSDRYKTEADLWLCEHQMAAAAAARAQACAIPPVVASSSAGGSGGGVLVPHPRTAAAIPAAPSAAKGSGGQIPLHPSH